MALKQQNLAGSQVWGDLVTDAADPQDIDQASNHILRGLLALCQALKASDLQLANVQGLTPVQLDSQNLAALRRIQERATTTGRELVPLLLTGSIKDWEQLVIDSFQHGMSLHLEEPTMKQQLVQEFKLLLILGRRLVFAAQSSAAVRADITTQLQFRAVDGTIAMRTVSLMFTANCRTVVRLMEAWYDAQGGGVPPKKGKRATHQPGKPENRAMATRFYHNVLILLHWQAQLLDALVQVNDQMMRLKAAGHPKWFHPSSLTSGGGRFANGSAAVLAR